MNIKITGTGSYIPEKIIENAEFKDRVFFHQNGEEIQESNDTISRKFQEITGITERRYASLDEDITDLATIAASRAIENSGSIPESIDQIILAHNFGNVPYGSTQQDAVPSIASRVKHRLGIKNPNCVAYDILFGCPGWLQGLILARQSIKDESARKVLIIGADILSRVLDPHDRDSMIFADGAGAVVVEGELNRVSSGMICSASQTFASDETYFIKMDSSYNRNGVKSTKYLKMSGRNVYEFALKYVPVAMKQCLDKSGFHVSKLKKIFLHQANRKMDEAIVKAFYKLYNMKEYSSNIMPMNIEFLGNSSVATIPTLFDAVIKNRMPDHKLHVGDLILFASVGAGMNVNAVCYVI